MTDLGWQALDIRRDYFLSTLVYKCIKGDAPMRLTNELIVSADTQGPVLLTFLRHVARISANGIAAFKESCAPTG